MQVDECLFNADHYDHGRHWSLMNQPILKTARYENMKSIVVCGAISEETGPVHFKYGVRSFNADDIVEMLNEIRAKFDPGKKLAVFWDNARIHAAKKVLEAAKGEDINIQPIFNLPYRPDLNGIESVWAVAKRVYRNNVDRNKATNVQWDQQGLVEDAIE